MNLFPTTKEKQLSKNTLMSSRKKITKIRKTIKPLTQNLSKLTSTSQLECFRIFKMMTLITHTSSRNLRTMETFGKVSIKM
jgi:site-specific recombinase XerD